MLARGRWPECGEACLGRIESPTYAGLEERGDRVAADAVALVLEAIDLDGEMPDVVIRWKDIFERLEEAIDACEHVANKMAGIIIKNG